MVVLKYNRKEEGSMRKQVTITVDSEMWEAVRQKAESENRTISNYVETILKQVLEAEQ